MSQKKMKQALMLSRLVQDPTFTVAEAVEAMELSEWYVPSSHQRCPH